MIQLCNAAILVQRGEAVEPGSVKPGCAAPRKACRQPLFASIPGKDWQPPSSAAVEVAP